MRKYLLLLDVRKEHVKFWRPQMLLLVDNPKSSCSLIHFVNRMKKSGLYIIGHVTTGDFDLQIKDPTVDQHLAWMDLINHLNVKAFVDLTIAATVRAGAQHIIRLSGIGGMRPNTIIMGFLEQEAHKDELGHPDSPFYDEQLAAINFVPNSNNKMSPMEYVLTLNDILKLGKGQTHCKPLISSHDVCDF